MIKHTVATYWNQALYVRVVWRATHCLESTFSLVLIRETSYHGCVKRCSSVHGWILETVVILVPVLILKDGINDARLKESFEEFSPLGLLCLELVFSHHDLQSSHVLLSLTEYEVCCQ